MSVLIIGGGGLLASRLLPKLPGPVRCTSRTSPNPAAALDLAEPDRFDYSSVAPGETVLLAGGISSPDRCLKDVSGARAVNVDGTIRFARRCLERGARIIFFSSDNVYGETGAAAGEDSPLRPLDPYGRMKAEVEEALSGEAGFKTIRLSYVVFLADKVTSYLLRCSREGRRAEVYHPYFRSAIHLSDVVDGVRELVAGWERFPHRAVNFGGPALISRRQTAEIVAGLVGGLSIDVVDPGEAFFRARPKSIELRTDRLCALLGRGPKDIGAALAQEYAAREAYVPLNDSK